MPGVDGPVCLTQSAPSPAYEGSLLLYDVIPSNIVSRSGVLSSIIEAGGDARLPEAVTLSEFKTWVNTNTATRGKFQHVDMEHACSVLKVADALNDQYFDDWLKLTARITLNDATSRCDGDEDVYHHLQPIFCLPGHLLHRLLQEVLRLNTGEQESNLFALLFTWPSDKYAAIVAAAITPEKQLLAHPSTELQPVAEAIALLPAAPPSLLDLRLECAGNWAYIEHQAQVQAVATALCHHSALTHLSIASFAAQAPFAQAIATLTSLQALHLGGPCYKVTLQALPQLKTVLASLPCLQDLMLAITGRAASRPELEHLGEGHHTEDPQHCLASLLSGATALTSLDIRQSQGRRTFVANAPLSLPCLMQLKVTSDHHCIATALLSSLTAPVAALEVKHPHNISHIPQLDDLMYSKPLWNSMSKLEQLTSVVLELEFRDRSDQLHIALLVGPIAALASLGALQQLSITACLPMVLLTVQQLAQRESTVHHLVLNCFERHLYEAVDGACAIVWGVLLQSLRRLRLQHLEAHTRWGCEQLPPPGLAPLWALTQLTALHLSGWKSCLHEAEDREALASMQQLRSLRICEFGVLRRDEYGALVQALQPLSALTELELQQLYDVGEFVGAFARHGRPGVWPALQQLSLPAHTEEDAEHVIRAVAAAFPAPPALTLLRDDGVFAALRGDASARLKHLASDCGICLAIEMEVQQPWWSLCLATGW